MLELVVMLALQDAPSEGGQRAAYERVDVLNDCAVGYAAERLTTDATPEQIGDGAVAACRTALEEAMATFAALGAGDEREPEFAEAMPGLREALTTSARQTAVDYVVLRRQTP